MLGNFGYIGLFALVAIGMAVLIVVLPVLLRYLKVAPYKPTAVKNDTYECGMKTIGPSWIRFHINYYFYALLFVALDVMVVFLYPWAVGLRQLSVLGFAGMIVFILVLVVGYIYAWKKKALEWK
jgi:NADH-quinone oxidoreductase subunit A